MFWLTRTYLKNGFPLGVPLRPALGGTLRKETFLRRAEKRRVEDAEVPQSFLINLKPFLR